MRTARINDGHASYLCGSALLPRPSLLKLFSLPVALGASFCLALGPHPPPTMRSYFIGTRRGGVIAKEIVASHVQAPPAFCTEAKVAKGGAYLRDTTVYKLHIQLCKLCCSIAITIIYTMSALTMHYVCSFVSRPCQIGPGNKASTSACGIRKYCITTGHRPGFS